MVAVRVALSHITVPLKASAINLSGARVLPFTMNAPSLKTQKLKKAISRIKTYRLIRDAAEALVFQSRVSCSSLHKKRLVIMHGKVMCCQK